MDFPETAPRSDKASKVFYWAREFISDNPGNRLNYDVRVLVRRSVLSLNAIAGASRKQEIDALTPEIVSLVSFNTGSLVSLRVQSCRTLVRPHHRPRLILTVRVHRSAVRPLNPGAPSARPSSAAFLKTGRILHRFIILMLLGLGLASQPVSGQTGASTLETQMISYDNEQVFTVIARFPSNRAWSLERGLFLSPQPGGSGAWIPIATGYGNFLPPTYSSFLSDAYAQLPQLGFTASLQSFPLVPVELLPSSLGLGPRPQYLFVHAAMRFRPSDGIVYRGVRD